MEPDAAPARRPAAPAADVFHLRERDALPVVDMVYRRPPDRVARIPMWIVRLDAASGCWLNELAPKAPLRFDGEVVLDRGYWGAWFLGNGAGHDLGKVYRPDGRHTGYYVDVLEPVRWRGDNPASIAPLTDLFLDLWLAPDGRFTVLDEPEFAEAEARGWITPEQAAHARRTLADLVERARAGRLVPPEARAFDLRW